jgi:hypothetical protein
VNFKKIILIGSLLFLLAGCANFHADSYIFSSENVSQLQGLDVEGVSVGEFTSDDPANTVACRAAGEVISPQGMMFAEYIGEALKNELAVAGLYEPNSDLKITGHLRDIALDSVNGEWFLHVIFQNQDHKKFTVQETYEFPAQFEAGNACQMAAKSLYPAVQKLLQELIRH